MENAVRVSPGLGPTGLGHCLFVQQQSSPTPPVTSFGDRTWAQHRAARCSAAGLQAQKKALLNKSKNKVESKFIFKR